MSKEIIEGILNVSACNDYTNLKKVPKPPLGKPYCTFCGERFPDLAAADEHVLAKHANTRAIRGGFV